MLFKAHSAKYVDDFGLELNERTLPKKALAHLIKERVLKPNERFVYLYDRDELQKISALDVSPVVRVNVLWMAKDLKLKCGVAATLKQKKQGLQGKRLAKGEGLFFPYAGPTNVVFHQGSVDYPLDILFVQESRIAKIEADTEVGGSAKWSCSFCDSVIETQGGFCFENGVNVGDELVYFTVSAQDEIDLQREKEEPMSFLALAADLV